MKTVEIAYHALLREQRGVSTEQRETAAATAADLYTELSTAYPLTLAQTQVKVAINDHFADWQAAIRDGDRIAFIPPVAGG